MYKEFIVESPTYGTRVILVDEEDYERIIPYTWYVQTNAVSRTFYAGSNQLRPVPQMHRFILGIGRGDPEVDHINNNGLDNRKSNLRLVTRSINVMNSDRIRKAKLIRWQNGGYRLRMTVDGKPVQRSFRSYQEAEEAAQKYKAETQRKIHT